MSLYNRQGKKMPKITQKERLRILLLNSIELYADVHSDRYNSKKEFMCILYDELGTDDTEMKELGIDLLGI